MNLNWTKNAETGSYEANLSAKLKSVSETVFQSKNDKKTEYRIAIVQLPNGKDVTAMMYEANYRHGVTPGTSYLCKAIYNKENGQDVLITVSHLVAGERASIKDLGFSMPSEASIPANTEFSQINGKK